jgi:hypothetical protein
METQTWTKFANGVWKRCRKPTVTDHLRRINSEHEAIREATRLRNAANDQEWLNSEQKPTGRRSDQSTAHLASKPQID